MTENISLIMFDLDGTLVDTKVDIANAMNYSLVNVGLQTKDVDTITSYVGDGLRTTIHKSLDQKHDELLDKAVELFKFYYFDHPVDYAYIYPGVNEFLERTKYIKKAIVSNKDTDLCIRTLEVLKIDKYFDIVLGGEDPHCRKPDPCPLIKVMKQLKKGPAESMIVGDMDSDINAGKLAGIATCGVTYGFGKIEDIKRSDPEYLIENFSELSKIFKCT